MEDIWKEKEETIIGDISINLILIIQLCICMYIYVFLLTFI